MIFNPPLARNLGLVLNQSHPYSLHLGGVDIVSNIAGDSVRIVEAGPGGVSSMEFTVLDSDVSMGDIPDDAEVRMWDVARDLPMFLGFVERVSPTPWAAAGRSFTVSCYGIESLLDTVIVPELVYNNTGPFIHGSDEGGILFWTQALLQVLVGLTGLRGGVNGRWSPATTPIGASTLANPIGGITSIEDYKGSGPDGSDVYQNVFIAVDLGGKTIRGALDAWRSQTFTGTDGTAGFMPRPFALNVDFWGGVRFFEYGDGVSTYLPTDYASLTVTNTAAGSTSAAEITWSKDTSPGAVVNAVYVKGAAAASTGWVVGDTTTGRRREGYATTDGLDADSKATAAATILNTMGTGAGRGTVKLENFTPINAHPTSSLVITDANLGWASKQMTITQIEKKVNPATGRQDWTVSFSDVMEAPVAGRASWTRRSRTLTRGTLH